MTMDDAFVDVQNVTIQSLPRCGKSNVLHLSRYPICTIVQRYGAGTGNNATGDIGSMGRNEIGDNNVGSG